VIPVFKRGTDNKPIYLFGKYLRKDGAAIFDHFLTTCPPKEVVINGPENHYYMSRIHGSLYSMKIYPYFFDFSSSLSIDASDLIFNSSMKYFSNHQSLYWTYDARWISETVLLSLCSFDKKVWLYWIDVEKHDVIRKIQIDTKDILEETMTLDDNGSIIGMSKTYSQLITIE
jgi:hypothetical protein